MSWNPTPEQFQTYLRREIEMARTKLKMGTHPSTMLHSQDVVLTAKRMLT